MELVLDVEVRGETRRVEVDMVFTDPVDTAMVFNLCGFEEVKLATAGEWRLPAVKAMIYVKLVRESVDGAVDWNQPPFELEDVELDWGELSDLMLERDHDMEALLAAASKPPTGLP